MTDKRGRGTCDGCGKKTRRPPLCNLCEDQADIELTDGYWWNDRGIMRWVAVEPIRAVPAPRTCQDCDREVGPRAQYCDTCGTRRRRANKRATMQRIRSRKAA